MSQFTDRNGRTWQIQIDVATIRRVRSMVSVNLLEIVEGSLIERLSQDPLLLGDVLYAVIAPQAQLTQVSEEDFGRGLAGNTIAEATAALLTGLVDFFPEPRRRLLGKAAAKYQQVQQRAMNLIETELDDPRLEEMLIHRLEKELAQRKLSDSSTDSLELPESNPAV